MNHRHALAAAVLAMALGAPVGALAQGSGAGGDAFSTCSAREAASDTWAATYAATAFDVQVDPLGNTTADFIQFSVLLTSVKTKGAEMPIIPSNFVGNLVGFCEVAGVLDLDPPLCESNADCAAPATCVDQRIPLPGNATYVASALGKIEADLAAAVCSGACDPGETLCVKAIADGATASSEIPSGGGSISTITEMSQVEGLLTGP